jgi:hypothetical protein
MNKRIPNGSTVSIQHPTLTTHPFNGREGVVISWVCRGRDGNHYYDVVIGDKGGEDPALAMLSDLFLKPLGPPEDPIVVHEDIDFRTRLTTELSTFLGWQPNYSLL